MCIKRIALIRWVRHVGVPSNVVSFVTPSELDENILLQPLIKASTALELKGTLLYFI